MSPNPSWSCYAKFITKIPAKFSMNNCTPTDDHNKISSLFLNLHIRVFFWVFQKLDTHSLCEVLMFFHFYALLLQVDAHFFARITCSRVSSIYCNYQNIIYFYVLLIQMTAFGFMSIAYLRFESIICTPFLFWSESSLLLVFSTNYCILSIFNFWNCPALISKYH